MLRSEPEPLAGVPDPEVLVGRRPRVVRRASSRPGGGPRCAASTPAGRHLQVTTTTPPRRHTANHARGDAARDAVDTPARRAVRQRHVETTTQTHAPASPRARGRRAQTDRSRACRPTGAMTRQGSGCARGRPGVRGSWDLTRDGRLHSRAGRRKYTPGRGVPPAAGRPRSPTRWRRDTCAGRRRRRLADRRPRLRQRPPDLRGRRHPSQVQLPCG